MTTNAQQQYSHLGSDLSTSMGSEALALQQLARLKSDLPEVQHAYKPSGSLPVSATVAMLLSVPLLVTLCILMLVVVVPIVSVIGRMGGIALMFLPRVLAKMLNLKDVLQPIIDGLDSVITNAIASLLLGVGLGLVCGYGIGLAGKMGKNRNPRASRGFAVAAMIVFISVAAATIATSTIPSPSITGGPGMVWMSAAIAIISGLVSALGSGGEFALKPFCEHHGRFMKRTSLPTLTYRAVRHAIDTLRKEGPTAFLAQLDSEKGTVGLPIRYSCTICGSGYCDVRVRYRATWGDNKSLDTSWLAASVALPVDGHSHQLVSATDTQKCSPIVSSPSSVSSAPQTGGSPPEESVLFGDRASDPDAARILRESFLGVSAEQLQWSLDEGRLGECAIGLTWMSHDALRYYLPVVTDYICSDRSRQDFAGIEQLLIALDPQFVQYHNVPADIRTMIARIATFISDKRRVFDFGDNPGVDTEELSDESIARLNCIAEQSSAGDVAKRAAPEK